MVSNSVSHPMCADAWTLFHHSRISKMADYKEVSPYTGQEIDEDAPANSVAGGGVSMPPDAVHDKKKKLVSSELSKVELLIESSENSLDELNNKKVSISEEQYNVNAMINSLGGQRDFYSELIESKEGFPEGTRFVLENPKCLTES